MSRRGRRFIVSLVSVSTRHIYNTEKEVFYASRHGKKKALNKYNYGQACSYGFLVFLVFVVFFCFFFVCVFLSLANCLIFAVCCNLHL